MEDLEVGLNRSGTITFTITEKVLLLVTGEVDIGLRPDPLPPIIQVSKVYCWIFLFVFMMDLDTGLIPANFLHITTVDYTWSTQGFFKNIFQGVCKEKCSKTVIKYVSYIHIKITLIIIIQVSKHNLAQACHHTLVQTFHHTLTTTYLVVSILHS